MGLGKSLFLILDIIITVLKLVQKYDSRRNPSHKKYKGAKPGPTDPAQ